MFRLTPKCRQDSNGQNGKFKRLGRKSLTFSVIALLGLGGATLESTAAQAAEVVFPIGLDFASGAAGSTLATNDDFWVFGTPTFTGTAASASGADGAGWLQLTKSLMNQTSGLISKGSIPSNEGATFEFDFRAFAAGNAARADGFSFFLLDADDPSFVHTRLGAPGAGLGYTSACTTNGIEKGYLGVGIDAYGNFTGSGGSSPYRNEAPGVVRPAMADAVVLRGSGDGGAGSGSTCGNGYRYATGSKLSTGNLSQGSVTPQSAQFRRARVALKPQEGTGPRITVSISALTPVGQEPTSWQENLLDYQVEPGNGVFNDLPENLRFGFAASTGGLFMTTQIGNFRASSTTDAAISATAISTDTAEDTTEGTAFRGDDVTFTLTATNNGPSGINAGNTPGLSAIFQDGAALGLENMTWTCEASNGGVCEGTPAQGGTAVNQEWSGPAGASVTLNVSAKVAADAPAGDNTAAAVIPTNFENNTVDPGLVSITNTGSVSDPDLSNNSAELSLNVQTHPSAADSSFSVSPGDKIADGSDAHTLTAVVKDADGVTKEGVEVTFEAPIGVTLSETSAFSDEDGIATVSATSAVAGNYSVSAALGAAQIGTAKTIAFINGAPSVGPDGNSNYTVSTGKKTANGSDFHTVTATVVDATDNPVEGVEVSFTSPTGTALSAPTATTNASGVASASVTATVAGDHVITASALGTALNATNAVASFEAGASSLGVNGKSDVTISTGSKIADGQDAHDITATVRDANGNPKSGVTVDFEASSDDATLSAPSVITDADGVAAVTVTSATAGSYTIAATVGGVVLKNSPVTAAFVAGAPDLGADGASSFAVSSGSLLADGTEEHTATATVLDADGNPVSGVTVTFGTETGASLSSASGVTNAAGVATTKVTSTVAGTYAVTAKVGDVELKGSPASVSFKAGAATASTSSWTVTPAGPVVADGSQTYTATVVVRDPNNNPVRDATVSFVVPAGLTQLPGSLVTNAQGEVTAEFSATTAADYVLSAKLGTDTIGSAATLTFVAGSISAGSSTISVTPSVAEANGTHEATVTISLFDAQGNAITDAGDVVELSTTFGTMSGITQLANGKYQATLTATAAGDADITFTVDGVPAGKTAQVKFVATPTAPVLKPSNGTVISGTGTPGTTVEVRNDQNQLVGSATVPASGSFVIIPLLQLADGDVVTAITIDENGFKSPSATVTIDTKKPAAPTVDPSNGKTITGGVISEGDEVRIVDGNGNPIEGELTIDEEGRFTFVPTNPIDESESVKVIITSPAGNSSDPEDVFIKTTPPAVPSVDPSNGKQITGGPIEDGDTVKVLDKDGNEIPGTVVVDEDGKFTFTPDTPLSEDEPVSIVIVDGVGNESDPEDVFIKTTPPTVPSVDPSNGKQITGGPIEDGDTVKVLDKDGNEIPGTVVVDEDGKFTFTPDTPLSEDEPVSIVIVDGVGNESEPEDVFIKTTPPATPEVDGSNGKQITGGPVGPEDTVKILDKDGNQIPGSVVVDEDGRFTFVPDTPLDEKDPVRVVIEDKAGNTSTEVPVFVKTTPPAVPVVDPTNGTKVTGGIIDKDSTATIVDGNGDPIPGVMVVGEDGRFTFTPETPLTPEMGPRLIVTDQVGNTTEVLIEVDTKSPKPATVDPSDGKQVTGCAEPGSTVIIRDAAGNVIGTSIAGEDCRFTVVLDPEQSTKNKVTVEVVSPAGNDSNPVELMIGLPELFLDQARLVVGGSQTARGFGFQPGESVTGTLRSEPVDLGTQVANAKGEVVFTFKIPAGLEAGTHSVTLEGSFSGSVSKTFEVYEEAVVFGLASTGSEALLPLGLGAILMLLGSSVLIVRRRNQRA